MRWRLVPLRYATMLGNLKWRKLYQGLPFKYRTTVEIGKQGFCCGPDIPPKLLMQAMEIYAARGQDVVPKESGSPFVNLFTSADIHPENPILRFTFSPEILDVAIDYFAGRLILDSIQVLYSYPTEGAMRESQYWHLDYGDRKSLHCVAYLKDVLTPDDGPFVYVNKSASKKIGRSMIVRRIPDHKFNQELKGNKIETFYGKAGNSVLVDPSTCYHYGSRCKVPRLAIFATFSSWFPFVQPMPIVTQNSQEIFNTALKVRPDLSEDFLKNLLQLA